MFRRLLCMTGIIAGAAIPAGTAGATTAVRLPPAGVLMFSTTPSTLGPAGGTVIATGRIKDATRCRLVLLSHQSFPVVYASNSRPCTPNFTARIVIGPNPSPVRRVVAFALVASNSTSSSTGRAYVQLAAPKRITPPTTATTTVPTTTTTAAPTVTTTTTSTTTTTIAPTTTTTTPGTVVAPITAPTSPSPNWAGYQLAGTGFSGITGTFTVPYLTTAATCDEEISEWIGIDGVNSSSLIQAGVEEGSIDPNTGKCSKGNFWMSPWWEILPAYATPITSMTVTAGDRITVTIEQVGGGSWSIELADDNNGQSFSTLQSYSGPGTSAEWIVEAPADTQLCGKGVDPKGATGTCRLAPYSPAINFSGVRFNGTQTGIADDVIVQGGDQIATPSPVINNGFSVAYGDIGPYQAP